MARFDLTTVVELTKRLYPSGLEELLIAKSPALGLIQKRNDFEGEGKYLVWQIASAAGQSSTFTNAMTNRSGTQLKRPFITRSKEYGIAEIDNELLRSTKSDRGALVKAYDHAFRSAVGAINRSLSIQFYGNGGGSRGKILSSSTDGSDTVLTVTSGATKNFEIGMVIGSSAGDGTSGSYGSTATVKKVDYENNTIRVATADSMVKTTGYYLFRDGDFGSTIKGLGAWNPSVAPSAGESFFGIDRSVSTQKLSGQRYAPGSGNIEDIMIDAAGKIVDVGGTADICFINPIDFAALSKRVNAVRTADTKIPARLTGDRPTGVGYDALAIMGPGGQVKVVADPWCPAKKFWMGELDTLEIWSLGDLVGLDTDDGNTMMRRYDADATEIRLKSYVQVVNTNPSTWLNGTLP